MEVSKKASNCPLVYPVTNCIGPGEANSTLHANANFQLAFRLSYVQNLPCVLHMTTGQGNAIWFGLVSDDYRHSIAISHSPTWDCSRPNWAELTKETFRIFVCPISFVCLSLMATWTHIYTRQEETEVRASNIPLLVRASFGQFSEWRCCCCYYFSCCRGARLRRQMPAKCQCNSTVYW